MNKIGEQVYGSHGGERKWIFNRIEKKKGKILDFGCGPKVPLGIQLAKAGSKVTAIDILSCTVENLPTNLQYIQTDLTDFKFEERYFDYILSCSSLEHAGLEGRYKSKDDLEQDLKIMNLFRRILKKGGLQFLTIPVGIEAVILPWHRVYGEKRLSQIFKDWGIIEEEFWNFDLRGHWYRATREEAFKEIPRIESPFLAAKGLYVLEKQ